MAKKAVGRSKMDLNITSMLDVVFNLILFFIIISNFAANDLPKLNLPQPDRTVAREDSSPNRVVVNIVPTDEASGMVKEITFASDNYMGRLDDLSGKLAAEVARDPNVEVVLRADRAIKYSDITPVMLAIAKSGVATVNLSASSQEP